VQEVEGEEGDPLVALGESFLVTHTSPTLIKFPKKVNITSISVFDHLARLFLFKFFVFTCNSFRS
jgi:hypothetical protein